MSIRVWFGDDYHDFADAATDEDIDRFGNDWLEFGDINTARQKFYIEGLSTDQAFLDLPRIDRHKFFNEAASGPYWAMLTPEARRALRGIVVDADDANEQQAQNYWDSPFSKGEADIWDKIEFAGAAGYFPGGKSQAAQTAASTIAELGRGLKRATPRVTAGVGAGLSNLADSVAGYLEEYPLIPLGPQGKLYTNPLFQTDLAKKAHEATGEIAEGAREVAIDASVGADLITSGRKYATFKEGLEEGGVGGVLQAGAAMIGEQAPVIGAIAGASMVPGVGGVLGPTVAAGLQTGSILEDLEREGLTGDDARTIASVLGVVTGAMEYLPIGRIINRNPIVATTWKKWIARKALQALEQGGEEAVTEFMQSGVESAAADFVRMNRGELDTIEAWTTPEGQKETLGDAWQSAIEGGFIGAIMGPFGGGPGQVTGEPGAQPAAPPQFDEVSPEVQQARDVLARLQGDQGPQVPPFEQMEDIPVTQPEVRPEEIVGPPGPSAPPGDTLPLGLGPRGVSNVQRGEWSEEAERKAKANYAPPWLADNTELTNAFIRGDIDQDVMAEMIEHADAAGIPAEQAMMDITDANDRAFEFLRGEMIQGEVEPIAVHPREPMEAPPVQPREIPLIEEGREAIPGAVGPEMEGAPPVQPEAIPLMEGKPEVSPMDVGVREPQQEPGWREGGPETQAVTPPEGEPGTPPAAAPAAAPAAPAVPAVPAPVTPSRVSDRRTEARGRDVDEATSELFNLQRKKGLSAEVIGRIVSAIKEGTEPHVIMSEEGIKGQVDQDIYDAATKLADTIHEREVRTESDRRIEAEIFGEEEAVPEGPPPEATGAELEALVKGKGEVEAGIKPPEAPTAKAGPVVIDTEKQAEFDKRAASRGNVETVTTPDSAMEEEVEWVLIEADKVTASHDTKMAANPAYPEALQPRDRTRIASEAQVNKILTKLDPKRLGSSRVSTGGAPIVGADGIVESGNARIIALQRGYAQKHGNMKGYKQWLIDNAEKFGIDKRKLFGMAAPVLVRVRKSAENREEFARKSNEPEVAGMSPAEAARADADRITPEMMAVFDVGETGNILADSNREFVNAFLASMSDTERSRYATAEGGLNQDGVRRIQNAVLAKAYGESSAIETLIEDPDNAIKRIGNALLQVAPKAIATKSGIIEGTTPAHLDIIPWLMEAVEKISQLRNTGKDLRTFLDERGLYGELITPDARTVFEFLTRPKVATSAKQMADMLDRYFDSVSKETITETAPAFDGMGIEASTLDYLLQRAIEGDQDVLFDLSKAGQVNRAKPIDIKRAFRGWDIRQVAPGRYQLTRKGQPVLHVVVSSRTPTDAEVAQAAEAHGLPVDEVRAAIKAGELAVKGSYVRDGISGTHLVSLYSPEATPDTVFEEAFHFAFHNVLTPGQRKVLFQAHETEENAAAAYVEFANKPTAPVKTVQKIFQAIRNFAKRLLDSNQVDIQAAARIMKKIASGDIFDQPGDTYTATNPLGSMALNTTANTVLNAREAARAAQEARKLKASQWTEAVRDALDETGHSFVDRGNQAMFSLGAPADVPAGHHPGTTLVERTRTEFLKEAAETIIVNKLGPIRIMQEKLTGVGRDLDALFNAYLKAQNFQSRAGALIDWVEENLFRPFLNDLAVSGVDMKDFDLFRMAAHALERNPKLEASHVGIPIRIAEKTIKKLRKRKITKGTKVRALDKGNVGEVVEVFENMGKAQVLFVNEAGFGKKVLMPMVQLERESIARAKDDIAEIRRKYNAGEMPNSGISNEHAKAILEEFKALGMVNWTGTLGPKTTYNGQLGDLSKKFSDIVRWKENTLFKAGLLSKKELEKWRDYKHYSPMRGKDPDIMDLIRGGARMPIPEIEMYGGKMWHRVLGRLARATGLEKAINTPNTGRGYNPGRRPAAHRALGRRSFPQHSPTVELFTDAMEAAVRAEKNRVGRTVWNLVNRYKDAKDQNGEKLFEIDRPDSRLAWDERTGTVKTQVDGMSVMQDNVYSVWIDGELHYIRHVSPEMAEFISALNNLGGGGDMMILFKAGSAVNRYISRMATSLNPAFTIPNAFRDAFTAGVKLLGQKEFEGFGLKTMKKAPEAWATLADYARRQSKGTLDEMDPIKRKRVEDFKLAGGETAFWMVPDLALQMRKIQSTISDSRGEQLGGLRYAKSVISFIEDYNAAVESTMRFSVYERALEMGFSKDEAGRFGRNITVDFTQQGSVSRHIGSLYVFANASIQGTANMLNAVGKNKPIQKMMLASMGMAFTHAAAMRFVGGEDEEDGIAYWDKVPQYTKSRNIVFMIPGTKGKHFKIPLPWGYNVFWNAATSISDAMLGPKTADQAFFNIVSAMMSSFNPIGDNDLSTLAGLSQMVMPAWADPVHDIVINKTFWGGPIRPEPGKYERSEQYGKNARNYNLYFSGASTPSKELTKALYKVTGLDVSPEDVDYTIGAVFGGLGDLINRTINLASAAVTQRRALVARDFPIVKSFIGDESNWFAPEMYRANMGDYWQKKETYDDLLKTDRAAAADFRQRHFEVLRLEDLVKRTEKKVRELKKKGVKLSEARMQREFKQFNRRYSSVETQVMKRRIRER